MNAEPCTITFTRYRTPEGKPTCAFETGAVCEFHRLTTFGTRDVCRYLADDPLLHRSPGAEGPSLGYLIPHKRCPLWVDK